MEKTPVDASVPDAKSDQAPNEIEKRVYFNGNEGSAAAAATGATKPSTTSTARSGAKSTGGVSYTTIRLDDCFNSTLTYIQPHIVGISRSEKRVYFRRHKHENELILDSAAKLLASNSQHSKENVSTRLPKTTVSTASPRLAAADVSSSAKRNRMSHLNMNEKVKFAEPGLTSESPPGVHPPHDQSQSQTPTTLASYKSATSSFPIKHARLVFYDSLLNKSSSQLLSARYRLANRANTQAPPELEDTIELVSPHTPLRLAKKRTEANETPSRLRRTDLAKKLLKLSFNNSERVASSSGNQHVMESSGQFLHEIDNQLTRKKNSKDDIKLMLESIVSTKQASNLNNHLASPPLHNRSSAQILINDYIYLPENDKEAKLTAAAEKTPKSELLKKSQKRINFKQHDQVVVPQTTNGPSLTLSGRNAFNGSQSNSPDAADNDKHGSKFRSSKSMSLVQMPSIADKQAELTRANTSMFRYTKMLTSVPANDMSLNFRLSKRIIKSQPKSLVNSSSKMIDISFPSYQNYPQEEQKFVC